MKQLTFHFIRGLRNGSKPKLFIYWNLFTMLEGAHPDFLEEIIENYKEDSEDFFRKFHKSLRQWDVFSDDYAIIRNGKLTEENEKRRNEILAHRKLQRKIYGEGNDALYNTQEYKDSQIELMKVSSELRKTYVVERIGGHLDSIFYETISNDSDGNLYRYMSDFFELKLKEYVVE